MKKIVAILSLFFTLTAFTYQTNTDDILNALKQGNTEQFSKYFDNIVDVKLPEKDEIKSIGKTQAGVTMKSFFNDNKVTTFSLLSQRQLGDIMYVAGKLQGTKSYNITIMLKGSGDNVAVTNIRIN